MWFVVDECVGSIVARWLRQFQHDVLSIYDEARGLDDDKILQKAVEDNRILITADKDFGEMIFRERNPHKGVVLLRLEDERPASKINVLKRLLERYADQLAGNFVVVTETTVRIVRLMGD